MLKVIEREMKRFNGAMVLNLAKGKVLDQQLAQRVQNTFSDVQVFRSPLIPTKEFDAVYYLIAVGIRKRRYDDVGFMIKPYVLISKQNVFDRCIQERTYDFDYSEELIPFFYSYYKIKFKSLVSALYWAAYK